MKIHKLKQRLNPNAQNVGVLRWKGDDWESLSLYGLDQGDYYILEADLPRAPIPHIKVEYENKYGGDNARLRCKPRNLNVAFPFECVPQLIEDLEKMLLDNS